MRLRDGCCLSIVLRRLQFRPNSAFSHILHSLTASSKFNSIKIIPLAPFQSSFLFADSETYLSTSSEISQSCQALSQRKTACPWDTLSDGDLRAITGNPKYNALLLELLSMIPELR